MAQREKGPEDRKDEARSMALRIGALIVVVFAGIGFAITSWIDQYEYIGTLSGALLGVLVWLGLWAVIQR